MGMVRALTMVSYIVSCYVWKGGEGSGRGW